MSTTADIYPALLARQQAVYGYRHTGYWMDVGVPERYRQAHWDILNSALGAQWRHRLPAGSQYIWHGGAPHGRENGVTIMPPVVLGRDVALAPGACIGPYAVLGAGCRIGTNAVVRESILWEDVRVAPGARLYRGILGAGVHVQTPDLHTDVVYRI